MPISTEKAREYKLRYQERHPEKVLEGRRKYYLKNKEKHNAMMKLWREKNKEKSRIYTKNWALSHRLNKKVSEANHRYEGKLTIQTLQLVYEDNIKRYGTLTCYLCLKPILFNEDSLDHKTPAVRGGTNEYFNLGVAHQACNIKKRYRTEAEYLEVLHGV